MARTDPEIVKQLVSKNPIEANVLSLIEINNTLDEHLSKLVTSNKVIEGILKDISGGIDCLNKK